MLFKDEKYIVRTVKFSRYRYVCIYIRYLYDITLIFFCLAGSSVLPYARPVEDKIIVF